MLISMPPEVAPGLAGSPPTPDEIRVMSILDRDTILVKTSGESSQVRLACIDTPGIRQRNAGPLGRSEDVAPTAKHQTIPRGLEQE